MRYVHIQWLHDGSVFAEDAWDSQIGKRLPYMNDGKQIGETWLVEAKVRDDKKQVELTFELDQWEPFVFHGDQRS